MLSGYLVDHLGRKILLTTGTWLMLVSLVILGITLLAAGSAGGLLISIIWCVYSTTLTKHTIIRTPFPCRSPSFLADSCLPAPPLPPPTCQRGLGAALRDGLRHRPGSRAVGRGGRGRAAQDPIQGPCTRQPLAKSSPPSLLPPSALPLLIRPPPPSAGNDHLLPPFVSVPLGLLALRHVELDGQPDRLAHHPHAHRHPGRRRQCREQGQRQAARRGHPLPHLRRHLRALPALPLLRRARDQGHRRITPAQQQRTGQVSGGSPCHDHILLTPRMSGDAGGRSL